MTDTVIKGSGNSRTLVTVPNALALYPTHEELMTKWATEGIPVDIGQLEAIGCAVIGTLLNKANLLSDSVASNLGLSEPNRTPNQAFNTLRSLVSSAQSTANGRLRSVTGSYTGVTTQNNNVTGTTKSKSLNFSIYPVLVIVETRTEHSAEYGLQGEAATPLVMVRPCNMATCYEPSNSGSKNRGVYITWSSSGVSWQYKDTDTATGHDKQGVTYNYIAIG